MIDRFERFLITTADISRCWHKIASDEMEKYGLKGPHAPYLTILFRNEKGLTAPQLRELLGRDKADISRTMAQLEKKGIVKKEGIHQNLYRGVFKLTEKGRAAAEKVHARASLAVEMTGAELTDEKRVIFYEVLETIAVNLREISREGLPDQSKQLPGEWEAKGE